MWTRETAFQFLEPLEKFLSDQGYHCALGGGVMYKGDSDKDLDVIVYPHNRDNCLPVPQLWERLIGGLRGEKAKINGGSSRDSKDVRTLWVDGDGLVAAPVRAARRIDFFFLK